MATYYARKSGNINATDVWATTPTGTAAAQTFAAGDILVSNSFTITVNVSTDLGSTGQVLNDTTGGATAGGSFSLSNGVTLTANVTGGATACVTLAGTASATVVGTVTGGTSGTGHGVSVSSTGTMTITGAVVAGSVSAVVTTSSCTLNITGNVTGGAASSSNGVYSALVGGTWTITGNVTGGSATSNAQGIRIEGSPTLTVTGTVTGGSGSAGIINTSTASVTVIGTCVGASTQGATHNSTGTLTVTRAKGGPLSSSSVGVTGSSTGVTNVEEIEYGDLGASPTSGAIRFTDKTSNVAVVYRFGTTKKNLVDASASGLMPSAANVRSGTVYNGGNSTGTCAVPAAGSVALGVAVDNTTGTAALTPAAVWDYLASSATTSGSLGERLKNCATVASTGQQLADALTLP